MDERRLRAIATRQYGLVSRRQAAELGATKGAMAHLIATGRWAGETAQVIRVVGAPPDARMPLMAAILDADTETYAGRRSAGALWRLPGYRFGPIEVSRARGTSGRPPPGSRLFPLRHLPPDLTTTVAGIPVLTLPATLFQLAGCEHPDRMERILDQVCARSPGTLLALHRLLPELAERGRNGITVMRAYLDANPPGTKLPESGLERRFERILAMAGEKPLERQVDLGGHDWIGRVDYLDRDVLAIFEVDSITHHTSPLDRERDAERDRALLAAGFRAVERVYEEWIWYDPARAVAVVRDTRRRLRRAA